MAKETFPTKPITIIVPYAPGGSLDIAARALSPYMGQYLKTSIIISNLPGAGGAIGTAKTFAAKPDGYTLVCWYTLPPLLEEYKHKVPYRTLEFTPVAGISRDYPILVGHPEVISTIGEFLKQAKERKIAIGNNGPFSITGLQIRLMALELGLKINWVNYGGAAESLASLAGKHLDAVATMTESAMPMVRAGKLVPLLIFAEKRHPKFPSTPVPQELGMRFSLISAYLALAGPPRIPEERVVILEKAVKYAVNHPDYVAWREKMSTAAPSFAGANLYGKEMERMAQIAEAYKDILTPEK